jgi:hypothetical protein
MTPPYTPGGYGHALELLLAAKGVYAQHAGGEFSGGQCGDTRQGMLCTNATGPGYLNFSGTFDLIHFNYGLHDLANYSPALPPLPPNIRTTVSGPATLCARCPSIQVTSLSVSQASAAASFRQRQHSTIPITSAGR